MYEQHFGLSRQPFSVSPDPRFFFPAEGHRQSLRSLLHGVQERLGLMSLVGEVGTGKSTLIRTLLRQIDPGIRVAVISHTTLDKNAILQLLAAELAVPSSPTNAVDCLIEIEKFCKKQAAEKKPAPLLIIDEAQNLTTEALEEIRLLTNIETDDAKLVQLILAGQPELEEKFLQADLRQIKQRLSVQVSLSALSYRETLHYLAHRLRMAGGKNDGGPFSRPAMDLVWRASQGLPRIINMVCNQSLFSAFRRESESVAAIDVVRAILELHLSFGQPISDQNLNGTSLLEASEAAILRVALKKP